MPEAARISDMHICPQTNPDGTPHVGGQILSSGSSNVLICGLPAALVGDMALCSGPPDTIITGSKTVLINGRAAIRIGDLTAHGGMIVQGCPTVNIGG